MPLRLYDTLTRAKRAFIPVNPERVTMYVCGPTVYNYAHVGNARPVVVFDTLFRLLRRIYGDDKVLYAANVTDVDDKINQKAMDEGVAIEVITRRYLDAYHADMSVLGALPTTFEPRATATMDAIIAMIGRLVRNNAAYEAEGHVLFNTQAYSDYGKLSGRTLDDMIAGARVEVAPYKRDPMDFVLWKPSKPGEPDWPSPCGISASGRPGWHIECSAMAWKHLGEKFDIHGGGIDLVFPHHENELAQTCCAFHSDRMANVWMHNGFLQLESEKMSKSLGNFFTIREMLADWPGEVLRLSMLKTHYHSPLDWTLKSAEESARMLDDWYAVAADVEPAQPPAAVVEALYDDLNTAQAMAALHSLRNAASSSEQSRKELAGSLRLLGFLSESAAQWEGRKRKASGVDAKEVDALIAERTAARARKDFKESDRIRDQLAAMGVAIKDSKEGTTWEVVR